MKNVEWQEIQEKTPGELEVMSREMRTELFNLKLQKASSQLEKTARLRDLRRDIARVETLLRTPGRKPA